MAFGIDDALVLKAVVDEILLAARAMMEGNRARNEINDLIANAIASAGDDVELARANIRALYEEARAYNESQWEQAKSQNPLLSDF